MMNKLKSKRPFTFLSSNNENTKRYRWNTSGTTSGTSVQLDALREKLKEYSNPNGQLDGNKLGAMTVITVFKKYALPAFEANPTLYIKEVGQNTALYELTYHPHFRAKWVNHLVDDCKDKDYLDWYNPNTTPHPFELVKNFHANTTQESEEIENVISNTL